MAVEGQVELLLALERGTYDAVVGTAETEDIDFKETPYQLDLPRQKWELANRSHPRAIAPDEPRNDGTSQLILGSTITIGRNDARDGRVRKHHDPRLAHP